MNAPAHEGLLAPSDIADLAGVSRAAVSNWRKRMNDFPEPSDGSAAKPLFAAKDVEAWLDLHPEKRKTTTASLLNQNKWQSHLWGVANLFRGQVDVHDFGKIFVRTAVDILKDQPSLTLRKFDRRTEDELTRALQSIPREDLATAVDGLLERTSRSLGKAGGETGFVGSRSSALLASLAAMINGRTLYDPACGIGVALLQALDMGATPHRLVGHEINTTAAEIAVGRAELRGVKLEMRTSDVLSNDPDPHLRADVIIAEPPFGMRVDTELTLVDPRLRFGLPPRSSSETYWIQHVIAHLAPGGIGFVLTSPGALFRSNAEAKIRRNLLLGGWIRAVVALPSKMLPQTAVAPVLWVLGESEPNASKSVLLIDASAVETPEREVGSWLTEEESLGDIPHTRVPIDELAADKADLTPARWMMVEQVDMAHFEDDFSRASALLAEASHELPSAVKELGAPLMSGEPSVLSIAELAKAGAIEVAPARRPRQEDAEIEDRRVDAAAVRTRNLPPVASTIPPEHAALTRPGDVLLTTVDKVRAIVDEEGGHLPYGSICRIRVLDSETLDPHYLADILTGEWNLRFATGSAIQRIPVREIEIPVLPLSEQRAVHATISRAREAKRLADQASDAADNVTTAILNAVRYGAVLSDKTVDGGAR